MRAENEDTLMDLKFMADSESPVEIIRIHGAFDGLSDEDKRRTLGNLEKWIRVEHRKIKENPNE